MPDKWSRMDANQQATDEERRFLGELLLKTSVFYFKG